MLMNTDVMNEYRFFPMDDDFITDKNIDVELYTFLQGFARYSTTATGYVYGTYGLRADVIFTPKCEEIARRLSHGWRDDRKTGKAELTGPSTAMIEKRLKYLLNPSPTNPHCPYIEKKMDDYNTFEIYQFILDFTKENTLAIKADIVKKLLKGGDEKLKLYIVLLKQFLKQGTDFIFTYDKIIELLGNNDIKVWKYNLPSYLEDLQQSKLIDIVELTYNNGDTVAYQLLNVSRSLPPKKKYPFNIKMAIQFNPDKSIQGSWDWDEENTDEIETVDEYDIPESKMLDLLNIKIDPEKCQVIPSPFKNYNEVKQ